MQSQSAIGKENNFGALRLLFATLVIISHSPALLGSGKEPTIGPLTFGSVAVDGFFLVSGFLVTKSFASSRGLISYFKKRVLRIYPGYVINFAFCILLIAPFVGAGHAMFRPSALLSEMARVVRLGAPEAVGAFADMPYPALNGSAWTIAYEFKCYIAIAMLGYLGFLRPKYRLAMLVGVVVFLVLNVVNLLPSTTGALNAILGDPPQVIRFASIFGTGMLFYLFGEQISYRSDFALAALVAGGALIYLTPALAEFALTVLGGYLIFWFAFNFRVLGISRFTNRVDLSYGIYLYAFPIQNSIAYFDRSISPWRLSLVALVLSAIMAYVSWSVIEKPALKLAHRTSASTLH